MIGRNSRFNYAGYVRFVDQRGRLIEYEQLPFLPPLAKVNHADNVSYTPTSTDSWSSVAWKLLGDGRYYWVVAEYSGVVDTFTELQGSDSYQVFGQISTTLSAGTNTSITLARVRGLRRGDAITIQDMLSGVEATTTVLDTNKETGVVSCAPFTVPGGGITASKSRVFSNVRKALQVSAPSASRAFFEALNFADPTQTLVE
jgi:hypothetical protein